MAKRVHSISFNGFLHEDYIIEELGKKDDPSMFYSLNDALNEFVGRKIKIKIDEEEVVSEVDDAHEYLENDEE
ncbi:hypothetical protein B7C51_25145 (plasmid) [Paenibacillus larvae subsp. pulvifaciens]|uniref:Bacillus phage SPbeta YonK domain-containing protein n=1 Tax=Paenibacillus larvae subsp. pulvifaciens TaxID=1477 RepID=A0A1V0V0T0_9BACL|nr:YonK family protein [Paenibacillus larvae]ARF70760.1 hypothetical protein B7C51_25145 [Paenibacillus larvae subsp. pulvifaciens]